MNKKQETKKENKFKLPKYLKLAKGSMWIDDQGNDASGVRIFAVSDVFVGRETKIEKRLDHNGKEVDYLVATKIPKDKYNNDNLSSYGYIDSNLPWYFDTTKIPPEKLSKIIIAYNYGILVEADPSTPPTKIKPKKEEIEDFKYVKGDRIFIGKNLEMFRKLQNLNFTKLKEFILTTPKSPKAQQNLVDLFEYEKKGYNPLNRPRFEVMEILKTKLQEYGNFISGIRKNDI